MLLLIASFYDPSAGTPRIGAAVFALWGIQLLFTISVHLRELLTAPTGIRIPASVTGALAALAVLLATPAFMFTLGPALAPGHPLLYGHTSTMLLPGEPAYLSFLGAYGLLFPVLFLLEPRGAPRALIAGILIVGLPCYLLGAFDFMTYLMPVPFFAALLAARRLSVQSKVLPRR
jgi:hypothetical protein